MSLDFNLKAGIPASPKQIYDAWLDSELHAKMTEGESALASNKVGADHKAHGPYIWGKNLELIPNKKIVQSWRSLSFKEGEADSHLEVNLNEVSGGTEIHLIHTGLPDRETDVENGWATHYFEPMTRFFSKK